MNKKRGTLTSVPSRVFVTGESKSVNQDELKTWEKVLKRTIDRSVQSLLGTNPSEITVSLSQPGLSSKTNAVDWLGGSTKMVTGLYLNIFKPSSWYIALAFQLALTSSLSKLIISEATCNETSFESEDLLSYKFGNAIGRALVTTIAEFYHTFLNYKLPVIIIDNAQSVMQIAQTEVLDQRCGDLLIGNIGITLTSGNYIKSPIILACSSTLEELAIGCSTNQSDRKTCVIAPLWKTHYQGKLAELTMY